MLVLFFDRSVAHNVFSRLVLRTDVGVGQADLGGLGWGRFTLRVKEDRILLWEFLRMDLLLLWRMSRGESGVSE